MPKTNFVDGDPSQGILGTVVPAAYLNALNNHYYTGLNQDGHGALPYAADIGTVNAYIVNLSPVLTTYVIGMPIYVKAANTNTGASTININNLGEKSIKKNLIEDLALGDIIAGDIVVIVFDGTNFQLIQGPQRDKLVASDIVQDFVVCGLFGTDPGASLTMTIPAGVAYVMGRRVVKLDGAPDLTRIYTASKDTYVDISHTGAITYTEVANGASAPVITPNSIRLMKAVTQRDRDQQRYGSANTDCASFNITYCNALAVRNADGLMNGLNFAEKYVELINLPNITTATASGFISQIDGTGYINPYGGHLAIATGNVANNVTGLRTADRFPHLTYDSFPVSVEFMIYLIDNNANSLAFLAF